MELITLVVGKPYPLKRNQTEGATANFLLKGGSYLQITLNGMDKTDSQVLWRGDIKAGFIYEDGALLFLFQFFGKDKKPYFTFDAPFDMRIIPADKRDLHSISNAEQRIAFEIHVIDENNICRGLRLITMPPDMTISFLSAVQEQLATLSKGDASYKKWLQQEPRDLIKKAKIWTLGE